MKEVTRYICEICNTEYNNRFQCDDCEKSHKITAKIKKAHYISIDKDYKGYPQKIDVEFEDGKILKYKRE